MMELLNLLVMLVLVLAFLALLIGVPLGLVWLLVKGLGRLAGNRNKVVYFLQPLIGIFFLSTGTGRAECSTVVSDLLRLIGLFLGCGGRWSCGADIRGPRRVESIEAVV